MIDLNYDTTSMSSSDKLQIFYESEDLEIKPARTYRDPVSKFRVSEPENLIDTECRLLELCLCAFVSGCKKFCCFFVYANLQQVPSN